MKAIWTILKKDMMLRHPWIGNPAGIRKDKKIRGLFIGQMVIFVLLILPCVALAYFLRDLISEALLTDYTDLILGFAQMIALMLTLVTSVVSIFSTLYFGNDIKIMQRFPFSDHQVIASQIIKNATTALAFDGLIVLVFAIWHGILTNRDALYYLNAILGSVALVLTLISFLTLLVVLLMRFLNRIPNLKAFLQLVGLFLVLVISIGPNILSNRFARSIVVMESSEVGGFAAMIRPRLEAFFAVMPTVRLWMVSMFSAELGTRIWTGLAGLAIGMGAFLLTILAGAKPLADGVRMADIAGTNRKAAKRVRIAGWNRKPKFFAIAWREALEIFKTPVYLYNIGAIGFLMPIILGVSMYPSMSEENTRDAAMRFFLSFASTFYAQPWIRAGFWMAVGILIGLFMGGIGQPATTSLTREGKRVWLVKTLPFTIRDQIHGRLTCSFAFGLLATAPSLTLVFILLKATLTDVLIGIGTVLICIIFTGTLGLLIDAIHPNFNWVSPQHAIKRSFNLGMMTIGILLLLAGMGFGGYKLIEMEILTLSEIPILLIGFLALLSVISAVLYFSVRRVWTVRLIRYDEG